MITIPTRALPEYILDVTLDAVPYRGVIKWNTRGAYYTLDILTREGDPIVSGLKLCLNARLIQKHPGRGLPTGELFVVDPSGGLTVILYDDLEGRISLTYATEAELAAL